MARDVLYYFLWILWDIVDLVCIYNVMHVMFDMAKIRPRKRVAVYFAIYILIALLHPYALQTNNVFGKLLFVPYYMKAFPIICECLKYNSKGQVIVNIWMYEVLLNFIQETIFALLFDKYTEIVNNRYFIIIIYFVEGFVILIATSLVKRQRKIKQISLYFSSLSLTTYIFLSFAIFCIMIIEGIVFCWQNLLLDLVGTIKITLIVLIVSFICLIITLFFTSKEKGTLQSISDLLVEQIENMTAYYEQISKKDEELRRFKHDSKNLLLGLYSMLEANDIEQAKEYIKSMEEVYQSSSHDFNSGNYIADALMSTKKSIAEQYHIKIDFEGFIPAQKIKDTDLCIFLTNILDNAIEACQKIQGERYIHIKSSIVKHMWIIIVSNPINNRVEIVNNTIETTKEDKKIHGYGLLNIRRVVEKYHGQMKINCEKGKFVLKANFALYDFTDK